MPPAVKADTNTWVSVAREHSLTRVVFILLGYGFLTNCLVFMLEPGMRPPGYLTRGGYALLAAAVGVWHVAGLTHRRWLLIAFGGLCPMLLLPWYLDGYLALDIAYGYVTRVTSLTVWTTVTLLCSITAGTIASIRWRMIKHVPLPSPLCRRCGYDLRASTSQCPECGTSFDLANPSTIRNTVREVDFRWLGRRCVQVLLFVMAPVLFVWGIAYLNSELPSIRRIENRHGSVTADSTIPREWSGIILPIDELSRRITLVDFRSAAITDDDLSVLNHLHRLEEIHFDSPNVTGVGFAKLSDVPSLTDLYLPSSGINDEGVKAIGSIRTIRRFELSATRITDASLGDLGRMPHLEVLWLQSTTTTPQAVNALRSRSSLTINP